jgi:predicted phage baseplate assembly protein
MTLPAPSLDDRRFQDLVDEAKKLIPSHCPTWTDHNVSDPGIALIELFAWMTELTIYRLNQVPDRLYVKFLELVGIELFAPSPARCEVVFALAAPATETIQVSSGTQVSTDAAGDEPIVFMTDKDLTILPPHLSACLTRTADGRFTNGWENLQLPTQRVVCFPTLRPGDALYLGFSAGLAGNLIRLDVATSAEGAGVDPRRPPRQWQAWDGHDWQPVRILDDSTSGFNTSGQVTLLLPQRHEPLPVSSTRAWWLRCRLMTPAEGQPTYNNSPELNSLTVVGLGGAAWAQHSELVPPESLGISTGEPGQQFMVRRAPVLKRDKSTEHVRVLLPRRRRDAPEVWEDWREVDDFSQARETDRVYTWSGSTGEIRFGPLIRYSDGKTRQHGAVPPVDAQIWIWGYRFGGGSRGNVGARALSSLRTSIPSVAEVFNPEAASGGVDAETVDNAKKRGPLDLRGGLRAVTAPDFERLTLAAARGVARAHCQPPPNPEDPVRVLVVPRVEVAPESLELHHLGLPEELESSIAAHLEAHRLITVRVVVDRPSYTGISVAARVRSDPGIRPETVRVNAEAALYRYINPVVGGPDGHGWPFGRDLNIGEVFSLLTSAVGVAGVEEVVLFPADLAKPRGTQRVIDRPQPNVVALADGTLFASCDHRVVIVQ